MRVRAQTPDILVIGTRTFWMALLFIPLLCLFVWLHLLAFQTNAPAWVQLLIGAFTGLISLIAFGAPERVQIVMDRRTGRAELRRRKGLRYSSHWFEIGHIDGLVANPPQKGFERRPGGLEKVFLYIHVTAGMDEGFHLVSNYPKSQARTNRVIKTTNTWLDGARP